MNQEKSGVIIINKPYGITSHDVVAKLRRLYKTKKVGHTGTLDPMATGVLPVLIGSAVKASEYLVSDSKQYRATMLLGITTDTEDTSGNILTQSDDIPDYYTVTSVINSFLGKSMQIPPMYSALKVGGKKLCDLARQGITVEREPRPIEVFSISAEQLTERTWQIDVSVSKGTYIRTLIADIGQKLGCGAAMSNLERSLSGTFCLENSYKIEQLEGMSEEQLSNVLLPTEQLFEHLEKVSLPDFYTRLAKNGAEIYPLRAGLDIQPEIGNRFRMADSDGNFFALGEIKNCSQGIALKPIKFF